MINETLERYKYSKIGVVSLRRLALKEGIYKEDILSSKKNYVALYWMLLDIT